MIGALLYLRFTSLLNGVVSNARKLRQPKFAFGVLAAAAYIYYFVIRELRVSGARFGGGIAEPPASMTPALKAIGAAIFFVFVAGQAALIWLSPQQQPGLRFSEAEIAFLFPAPFTRKRLVHFNLISSQFRVFFSSVLLTVVFSRWRAAGAEGLFRAIGWWAVLSALSLHWTGMSLVAARSVERGGGRSRIRGFALGVIGAAVAAAVVSFVRHIQAHQFDDIAGMEAVSQYAAAVLDSGLLRWLLRPFSLVVAPFLAVDFRSFAAALGPALLILGALYFWIVRMETPFEDGSIALAQKRAQWRSAPRGGARLHPAGAPKARRGPFQLRDRGLPETAFFWKNLLAIQSWFNFRVFLVILLVTTFLTTTNLRFGRNGQGNYASLVLIAAAIVGFYTLLAGPLLARQDLRNDIANADILKSYPLRGWRIVLGEMLTPMVLLSGILWVTLLAASWALGRLGADIPFGFGTRMVLTVCAALAVPPICALELVIPNAAAVLFPSWYQSLRTRGGGIDVMGQRLIFAFGQFLAVVAALLPAVLMAAGVYLAAFWWIGRLLPEALATFAAIVAATLTLLAVLVGELASAVWAIGIRFEKFDLSSELRP